MAACGPGKEASGAGWELGSGGRGGRDSRSSRTLDEVRTSRGPHPEAADGCAPARKTNGSGAGDCGARVGVGIGVRVDEVRGGAGGGEIRGKLPRCSAGFCWTKAWETQSLSQDLCFMC